MAVQSEANAVACEIYFYVTAVTRTRFIATYKKGIKRDLRLVAAALFGILSTGIGMKFFSTQKSDVDLVSAGPRETSHSYYDQQASTAASSTNWRSLVRTTPLTQ